MGIDAGHQALTGRFLITRGAVYLSCEEEVLHQLRLQCMGQLRGWKIVVFNRVTWTEYLRLFHPRNLSQSRILNILWQGSGEPI